MDDYAKKFLTEWVEKKLSPAPYQQQKRLATESTPTCLTDAMKVGITRREMEQASGGNLEAFLENAIEDKQDIEVRKNRPASN
jgi:hypothetical protein